MNGTDSMALLNVDACGFAAVIAASRCYASLPLYEPGLYSCSTAIRSAGTLLFLSHTKSICV